jgi:hypothetical protein
MYIVLWSWLILLIIGVVCAIVVISLYNTLIHLQKTCNNTLETILQTRQKKSSTIADSKAKELITHFINAKTNENQVKALNKLISYTQSISDNVLWKKIKAVDSSLSTEKRFYTNTARELNGRLVSFPGNLIGSMASIKELSLITLNDEESKGILPEAKYL